MTTPKPWRERFDGLFNEETGNLLTKRLNDRQMEAVKSFISTLELSLWQEMLEIIEETPFYTFKMPDKHGMIGRSRNLIDGDDLLAIVEEKIKGLKE